MSSDSQAQTSPPLQGRALLLARLAWSLWALSVALVALRLLLQYVNDPALFLGTLFKVLSLAFATVGALIASRRPENPVGWIFGAGALLLALSDFAEQYAVYALVTRPDALPGGVMMAWIRLWASTLSFSLMFTFTLLLIPNGRLLSQRWRPVLWLAAGATGLLTITAALQPGPFSFVPFINNPLGIEGAAGVLPWVQDIVGLLILTAEGASAISLILRFRRARGEERQQLKWVAYAATLFILFYIVAVPFQILAPQYRDAVESASVPVLAALPIAVGIAILKYRLYDIDLLINRSLVYGALTALLLALFGISLFIISQVFQNFAGGPLVAVAVSALAFGTVFQPARRNLQRFVDQRFYNIQIDYQKTPPPAPISVTNVLAQTRFGAYTGLELIGRGGMAEVYKSTHPTLGKPVAIKILSAHLAADPDFRKRFDREAQVVAKLQHPNIVRVFDFGEDAEAGTHYMVMEYLSGKDLGAYLRERGRLSVDQAIPIIRDIASALDYAHAQGLVHRDIKPSNVMLDIKDEGGTLRVKDEASSLIPHSSSLRAVLTDFGIAKIVGGHTRYTQTGGVLGTFDYIAPEQIQGAANVDGRADVYAFGVMVYQMLAGELPFKQSNPGALLIAHMTQPAPDPREVIPDLSREMAHAVQRAMAKKPEERFNTAGEFVAEMRV